MWRPFALHELQSDHSLSSLFPGNLLIRAQLGVHLLCIASHRIAPLLLSPPVFDLLLSLAHSGDDSAGVSAIVSGSAIACACRGGWVYDCGHGNSGQNACNYIAPVSPPAIHNQKHN
jgi:hypothetical protein